MIKCCGGIHRNDHFISVHGLNLDQEKKDREIRSYDNMSKSMSIGSVLIAISTFSTVFGVLGSYKTDISGQSPGLSLALKAFTIIISYAFICSITATALLIEAALTFLDPESRKKYLLNSA